MPAAAAAVMLDQEEAEVTHRALVARIVNTSSPDVLHRDSVPERIAAIYELAHTLAWIGQPADPLNAAEVPASAAQLVAETLRGYGEEAEGMGEGCASGDLTGRSELHAAEWWRREGSVARRVAGRLAA